MAVAPERLHIRAAIDAICAESSVWTTLTNADRATFARRIERGCFEVVIEECTICGIDRLFTDKKFVSRYSTTCAKIMANLNTRGAVQSDYLISRIISGEIDPYDIAKMDSYRLCPQASEKERKIIQLRREQKGVMKVSRAHVCSKCGGNATIIQEYQARAGDEGSTHSIKCVICEHVWRR
jgi:DNA-directed RNA polymerase subunit M/transcription elongation factor TFIIS